MLLRHIGEADAAEALQAAVERVLARGEVATPDLRSPGDDRPVAGTVAFADAVIAAL
jgi:isocitrate/isopropylmalate dehydrogenase